ncbi:hypothetical protein [Sessilibacter sp. MAH2]
MPTVSLKKEIYGGNFMWDWLKFFPYAAVYPKRREHLEIQGPYFSKPRQNKWFFGDSVFYFNAPWANPILSIDGYGSSVNAKHPRGRDLCAPPRIVPNYRPDARRYQWHDTAFYRNTWYFVGAWFVGEKARLGASAVILTAHKGSLFKETKLFHPRVFESAIANYLDDLYGYDRSGKRPHYRGPLHWRVLPLSDSIQGVVCDIHQIHNGSRDNPDLRRLVFFPVSTHQFVRITFNLGGVDIYHDELRAKPMLDLTDSIINSMRLQVGPKTQAEWDKVKATCDDMSIANTFGELAWPLFEEKKSRKKPEVDITPNDTPIEISKVINQHK